MATLADINETLKAQNETLEKVSDVLRDQISRENRNRREDERQEREDKRESRASRRDTSRPSTLTGGLAQGLLGNQLSEGLSALPQRMLELLGLSTLAGGLGLLAGRALRFGGAIALLQNFGEDAIMSMFESIDPNGVINDAQRDEIASRVTNSASTFFAARFLGVGRLASLGAAIGGYYGEEISNAIADVIGSEEFQVENPFGIGPEHIQIDLNDPAVQTVIGSIAGGLLLSVGRALSGAILLPATLAGVSGLLGAMGFTGMKSLVDRLRPVTSAATAATPPSPAAARRAAAAAAARRGVVLGTTAAGATAALGMYGAYQLDEYQRAQRAEDIREAEVAAAEGRLTAEQVAEEEDISFWRRAALSLGAAPQNVTEELDALRRDVTAAAGSLTTGSVDALTGERVVADEELRASLRNTLESFIGDVNLNTLSDANLQDIEAIARRIGETDLLRDIDNLQSVRESGIQLGPTYDTIPMSSLRLEDMDSFRETLPTVSVIAPEQMQVLIDAIGSMQTTPSAGGGGQTPSFIGVPLPADGADRRDW